MPQNYNREYYLDIKRRGLLIMNKSFFFTLVILGITSVLVSNAYAETGQNFDRTQIGPKNFLWSSHYDRMWDGTKWVNYFWGDNGNTIQFQSANIIYKLDKNTCKFSLLNPVTWQPSVDSYSHELLVDGTKVGVSACSVTSAIPTTDGLEIKVSRSGGGGGLVTTYEVNADGIMEWTNEITNTDFFKVAKFGVVETCANCTAKQTAGDFISFGDYFLDTENRIHNTLQTSVADKGNYLLTYEGGLMGFNQKLTIDPIFGFSNSTVTKRVFGTPGIVNANCFVNAGFTNTTTQFFVETDDQAASGTCYVLASQWDISSLPGGLLEVVNSSLRYDITAVSAPTKNCDYTQVTNDTNVAAATLYLDVTNNQSGIVYTSNDSQCTTVGNNKEVDLGVDADTDIRNSITGGRFAVGIINNPFTRGGDTRSNTFGADIELLVNYTTTPPFAVTDLTNSSTLDTQVRLSWSQPNLNNGTLSGYQINFTTPFGNPLTIITNNTGTSITNANITGLTNLTPYTFRVSAWTQVGNNATGNKLNVTTIGFSPVNFTLGFIDVNTTNPDIFPIRYARTDINATSLFLNVTYSNTYNLTCSFYYKFAMTNATYSNLPKINVSGTEVRSDFTFVNASREVIDVFCKNENTPNNATYILTQTDFPLLAQFRNFTGGVYGTTGQFGTVNLVTLGIIIASMIGFNRINPSVGAIFTIIIIFGAGYFGFITIPEQMIAAFILVAVLAFMTTRKDE